MRESPSGSGRSCAWRTGAWPLIPVEDPEGLDERRRSAGLGPIEDYVRETELAHGLIPAD
jgi:hypothetical protein